MVFRARGSLFNIIVGFAGAALMVWVGTDMAATAPPLAPDAPPWFAAARMVALLLFFGGVGALLFFVGAIDTWRMIARPVIARTDDLGIESRFLWPAPRRLAWDTISHLSERGPHLFVHAVRGVQPRAIFLSYGGLGHDGVPALFREIGRRRPDLLATITRRAM